MTLEEYKQIKDPVRKVEVTNKIFKGEIKLDDNIDFAELFNNFK